jgi:hypothetical protein
MSGPQRCVLPTADCSLLFIGREVHSGAGRAGKADSSASRIQARSAWPRLTASLPLAGEWGRGPDLMVATVLLIVSIKTIDFPSLTNRSSDDDRVFVGVLE